MRVMVTGSSGLIGRATGERLVDRGHHVVLYDLKDGFDVRHVKMLYDAMVGCEAVVHLAGISYPRPGLLWSDYLEINVVGTMNVARAAVLTGVRRMVFASSTSFYGAERGFCEPHFPVGEGDPPAIAWLEPRVMSEDEEACLFYSTAKVMAERGLAAFGLRKALQVVILRFCPTSPKGDPYEWGLRLTLDRAVWAILTVLERPLCNYYGVYNVAEDDVEAVYTGKWEMFFGASVVTGFR